MALLLVGRHKGHPYGLVILMVCVCGSCQRYIGFLWNRDSYDREGPYGDHDWLVMRTYNFPYILVGKTL